MKTLQVADDVHAQLIQRKAASHARRLDDVVLELLQPRPRKRQVTARIHRAGVGLQAMGVQRIQLFGSVVHDQARPGSDIDLIVAMEPGRTYFDLAKIQALLEDLLGARVDAVLPAAIHPALAQEILAEAEDVPLA